MKKEASSGEKKSGCQPVNNSLASFRHAPKGEKEYGSQACKCMY